MKNILLSLVFLYPIVLFGQQTIVEGSIMDTSLNKKLQNVVISFLKESDSTLISFVRSDSEGKFSKKVPWGSYILLVTSPGYADYVTKIKISENTPIKLNEIPLISKAMLLKEIIVTQQAIRIKGDTTEYIADSFRVKPNATVEDLLKELPGIQVDKEGTITAQGQKVQKILVDGDEFFSDDPTVATKNLRADAVNKVQVFDKKSDQSEFTGIDDGQRTKTINLELKNNAKNGYFGKVVIGGLDRYYNLQAMINAFKAKRKLAAFIIGSSTSETGLDWTNAGNYGFTSSNTQYNAIMGGVTISGKSTDQLGSGNFSGTGLPESVKGGLHYSNKWNNDKVSLSSNYLFNDLKVRSRTNTLTQNILENSVYYSNTTNEAHSDRLRNDLSGVLEIKLDSTSSIKIDAKGSLGRNDYNNYYQTENLTEQNTVINNSNRRTQIHNNTGNESVNILYRKKFHKVGKTFSLNLTQSYNQTRQDGLLYNESHFFNPLTSNLLSRDTTNQNKKSTLFYQTNSAKATYTHPLSAVSFLIFNYSLSNNNSTREKLTYDLGLNNKYDILNDSLSNKFRYNYLTNSTGLDYHLIKGKTDLSFGGDISNTNFSQHNFFTDTTGRSNYFNFFPRASFSYKFSSFTNLQFSYSGYTTQPTIDQVQPLTDNSDPLNIIIGNPDLKQSFTNSFQLFFADVKVMTERYLFAGANMSMVNNEINQSYYLDDMGRNFSQYANTDGNYTVNIFAMLNVKIPNSILRFGAGPLAAFYRYSNFVDNKKSITKATNLRARITLQARIPDKIELNIAAMPGYNISHSSLSKAADQKYWESNLTLDGNYQLPWKMEIGSVVTADLRQKITAFDKNNNIILWNAYIEKRFLKNESIALRASITDILDQNKGYSRYQLGTGLEEQRYLTWGQYGLISLTYNFVKKGSKGPENMSGGIRF